MPSLTNTENTMTFLTIVAFNQLQSEPLVCRASSPPLFWLTCKGTCWYVRWPQGVIVAPLALALVVVRGNTASILACVHVWSCFSHPQYSNQCCCPPLASFQWIAIVLRLFAFSVNFVAFWMFMLFASPPCAVLFHSPFLAIMTTTWPS